MTNQTSTWSKADDRARMNLSALWEAAFQNLELDRRAAALEIATAKPRRTGETKPAAAATLRRLDRHPRLPSRRRAS